MPKVKLQKLPVSRRAMLQRLSRHLAEKGLTLRSTRGRGDHDYFVLDPRTSKVEFVDPEAYARECRVLGDWEQVVEA